LVIALLLLWTATSIALPDEKPKSEDILRHARKEGAKFVAVLEKDNGRERGRERERERRRRRDDRLICQLL
jgi:hypothetical protein